MKHIENQEEYNYRENDTNAFYPHSYDEITDAIEDMDEKDIPKLNIPGVEGEEDLWDYINNEYTICEE